jgi:hypothetical protein
MISDYNSSYSCFWLIVEEKTAADSSLSQKQPTQTKKHQHRPLNYSQIYTDLHCRISRQSAAGFTAVAKKTQQYIEKIRINR